MNYTAEKIVLSILVGLGVIELLQILWWLIASI